MSGLMVALFSIGFPLLVQDFLLISLFPAGVLDVGVIMIRFAWLVIFSLVGFRSILGPLQSVQKAEMWCVILALQSSGAVRVGVDNLNVVRHVGLLLDGRHGPTPFELVEEGDLLFIICRMLHLRVLALFELLRLEGILMTLWFLTAGFGMMISCVTMLKIKMLILVVEGSAIM